MTRTIQRLCLTLVAAGLLGACTHRIEAPREPFRIEMNVVLKHEHHVIADQAGG